MVTLEPVLGGGGAGGQGRARALAPRSGGRGRAQAADRAARAPYRQRARAARSWRTGRTTARASSRCSRRNTAARWRARREARNRGLMPGRRASARRSTAAISARVRAADIEAMGKDHRISGVRARRGGLRAEGRAQAALPRVHPAPDGRAAAIQGARCMDCGIPFCMSGCPVNNIIPGLERPRLPAGLEARDRDAALDQQLSRVHRPHLPRARARRRACCASTTTPSASSRSSTRSSTRRGRRAGSSRSRAARKTGKQVAVVGSGPAGLACAQQLARAGHAVMVFEKSDRIGGLLRYGIPDFKMEKWLIDRRMRADGGGGRDVPARSARRQRSVPAPA